MQDGEEEMDDGTREEIEAKQMTDCQYHISMELCQLCVMCPIIDTITWGTWSGSRAQWRQASIWFSWHGKRLISQHAGTSQPLFSGAMRPLTCLHCTALQALSFACLHSAVAVAVARRLSV